MRYQITTAAQVRLDNTFVYHAPKDDQAERYTLLRDKAREFAELVIQCSPPSREQSLALTHIEEASMQVNAAIARNE